MEKTIKTTESSDLFRKIDALGLPASDRARALLAVQMAERIACLVEGAFKLLRLAPQGVVSNPKLKHQ
jgi:hypothetical protein